MSNGPDTVGAPVPRMEPLPLAQLPRSALFEALSLLLTLLCLWTQGEDGMSLADTCEVSFTRTPHHIHWRGRTWTVPGLWSGH